MERSDNGTLPLVIVPYFDPAGSTNAPPSEGESAVILGHVDPDWPVKYVRPSALEGAVGVAASAFPAANEIAWPTAARAHAHAHTGTPPNFERATKRSRTGSETLARARATTR